MAINQTTNKRKLSPALGCVMSPIFTSLSNDIFHVFRPMVSCPLQCSVHSSLFSFIVFLGLALSMFFLIVSLCSCYDSLCKWCSCCLIVTRRVRLVEQGLFSLSYHLHYHLNCCGVFCVMQCRSLLILSLVCLMLSVSLNCPFLIAPSVFPDGNVIFMDIHIYICHVK
jgi:isoprenylcysteine carboxyl methyltransferase (ICMT) family protein YpbQ